MAAVTGKMKKSERKLLAKKLCDWWSVFHLALVLPAHKIGSCAQDWSICGLILWAYIALIWFAGHCGSWAIRLQISTEAAVFAFKSRMLAKMTAFSVMKKWKKWIKRNSEQYFIRWSSPILFLFVSVPPLSLSSFPLKLNLYEFWCLLSNNPSNLMRLVASHVKSGTLRSLFFLWS